ncbi:MAG: Fe-S oxidoreductase [Elusimicrobia bacterium]|nr:MAG: Fe-S oxidoreductase [Elusimicrobiota bacterium]KAF0157338.1 MAG: Fe-S oxidoreductase [Elusimicrobiota bacterium]
MKILLIQPAARNMVASIVPEYVVEGAGHYPPLGLLYIAASLKKNASAAVEILDASLDDLTDDDIKREVLTRRPDVVGITATTFTLVDAVNAARAVKEADPGAHVCIGGPHTSVYPDETIALPCVDSIVLGEGEESFAELVRRLEAGRGLEGVEGVFFKTGGAVKKNPLRGFIQDLDAVPFPARELLEYRRYRSVIGAGELFTTLISSRGCPFNCLYCYQAFGRRYRARSAAGIIAEIRECLALGIKEFWFFDDNFTADRRRTHEFCDALLDGKLGVSWDMRTRVDLLDDELLGRLKAAGCRRVFIGIESGVKKTLLTLRKRIDLGRARTTLALVKKHGFETYLDFMIGSPGETREEILRTIDFAIELDPDYVQFAVTTPYPDTDLYKMGLETKAFKEDYWRKFAANPSKDFKPVLLNEHLSAAELAGLLDFAYKKFYMRPKYILKRLLSLRSLSDLPHMGKAAVRLCLKTLTAKG